MSDTEQYLNDQLALADGVCQIEDRTWKADSAGQALAWLRSHLYWPATVASRAKVDSGIEVRLQQRVFFRGHADARWEPIPTLFRLNGEAFHHALAAVKLASAIVALEFQTLWSADGAQGWPPFGEHAAYAAVQHYGFPTALLDWSSNPTIAVHFATCSDSSTTSEMASVLWLSAGDAADLGLKIVLPPVYVTRLYRQRGLFTELTPELVVEVKRRQSKIVFPAQPRHPAQLSRLAKIK